MIEEYSTHWPNLKYGLYRDSYVYKVTIHARLRCWAFFRAKIACNESL